jgi:hypothetical protein
LRFRVDDDDDDEDERSDATRAFVCVEFVGARSSRCPRVGVGVCGRNSAGGEF